MFKCRDENEKHCYRDRAHKPEAARQALLSSSANTGKLTQRKRQDSPTYPNFLIVGHSESFEILI
jgi:hypothetical protein